MNDKFERFLEMTDHPERFTDEELQELALDPEMAAWYRTLAAVEESAAVQTSADVKPRTARRFRLSRVAAGLLAAAAAVLVAVLVLIPKQVDKPQKKDERVAIVMPKKERPQPSATKAERVEPSQTIKTSPQTKDAAQERHEELTDNTPNELPAEQPSITRQTTELAASTMPVRSTTVELNASTRPAHTSTLELLATTPPAHTSSLELLATTPPAKVSTLGQAEEPASAEADNLALSPEKQAMADIYLAEVALQVAYEQQAQLQAVRAYAASITGQEEPQPIIAF